MKPAPRIILLCCLFVTTVCRHAAASDGAVTQLDLGGEWRLSQDDSPTTIRAVVPGCVHLDLLTAGKIPDPFFGDNEKSLQWIGEANWTYSRTINIPAGLISHDHLLLRCEGLDTVSDISVNDRHIAATDNMFRTYEFDVKGIVHAGDNSLKITFHPTGPYIKDYIRQASGPLSSTKGIANLRKAPYSNGWDFGPKFLTAGIYRQIKLVAFDQGRLSRPAVTSHFNSNGKVSIAVDAGVQHDQAPLSVTASLTLAGTQISLQSFAVSGNVVHFDLPVADPHLWWPAGMGPQTLYDLDLILKDAQGNAMDHQTTRVGLRKIELLPKTDSRPLRLAVNGREIFCKGMDWIPCDMFAPRVTADKLHRYIADAAAVNANMLRCWGGGYYEQDEFYDSCDELGILVWSEFEFACAVYPSGNPKFVDNVRSEVTDQVKRLRNHPCIAVWCGNNEVASLITGYKILKQSDYNALFHEIIGARVKELMPESNYVGGSPEAGDEHNWWVWHVGANFEKYLDSHGWMTEFGFQSFPCPATVDSYTEPADRTSMLSPVMKAHQHNGNGRGNEMIVEMMGRYFRPAKDFDSTLWLSQINQAYGVTMGIEHWRSDWPRSSGALVWQYDDCWPGPTWSSVDYYGRWKALHYKLKDAFAPLMVTASYDPVSGQVRASICSDLADQCAAILHWRLTDTDGSTVREGKMNIAVPAGTCSVPCPAISIGDAIAAIGRKNAMLWLDLENDGNIVSSKTVWFVRPKDLRLKDPQLTIPKIEASREGYTFELTAAHPALWAWANLDNDPDARFSDNFMHLLPGRSKLVHVIPSRTMSLDQVRANLHLRSLFDTYAPTPDMAEHRILSNADGTIIAPAERADIIGNSAAVEAGNPPNIGRWSDAGDELDWSITVDHPGKFHVLIDLACPEGVDGSEILLRVGTSQIKGIVPTTGGWNKYRQLDLGEIQIGKEDSITLSLHAVNMPHGNVMNLRSITLRPS